MGSSISFAFRAIFRRRSQISEGRESQFDRQPMNKGQVAPLPQVDQAVLFPSSGTDLIPQHSIAQMPVVFQAQGQFPTGRRRWRLLCYGDSLTAGFCDRGRHFEPYGRSLAEALARANMLCEVSVIGLSGLTASRMAEKVDAAILEDVVFCCGKGLSRALQDEQPQDLVIIMAGTNDLGMGEAPKTIAEDVWRLHQACHAKGVPTVALTVPPSKGSYCGHKLADREAIADLISSRAQGGNASGVGCLAIVDPGELVPYSSKSNCWEWDGLHYSQAGSQELGAGLAPQIKSLLTSLDASLVEK